MKVSGVRDDEGRENAIDRSCGIGGVTSGSASTTFALLFLLNNPLSLPSTTLPALPGVNVAPGAGDRPSEALA